MSGHYLGQNFTPALVLPSEEQRLTNAREVDARTTGARLFLRVQQRQLPRFVVSAVDLAEQEKWAIKRNSRCMENVRR